MRLKERSMGSLLAIEISTFFDKSMLPSSSSLSSFSLQSTDALFLPSGVRIRWKRWWIYHFALIFDYPFWLGNWRRNECTKVTRDEIKSSHLICPKPKKLARRIHVLKLHLNSQSLWQALCCVEILGTRYVLVGAMSSLWYCLMKLITDLCSSLHWIWRRGSCGMLLVEDEWLMSRWYSHVPLTFDWTVTDDSDWCSIWNSQGRY